MNRRRFLKHLSALGLYAGTALGTSAAMSSNTVMTVNGPLAPGKLGVTLPHEHVLVDFIGADEVRPIRYDREAAFEVVLPHLRRFFNLGGRTLVECTPSYLGRDPLLLQRLSNASGVHLLTNTGYYGARQGQHLPAHVSSASADELAERWIHEWQEGIGETGIRPGFIKIGVDSGPLSDVDRKLVRAAARTHCATGLTIASHTGKAVPAFEQLAILEEERVDPSAWIWVHAQSEQDMSRHTLAARRGAWIEFDGVSPDSLERHVTLLAHMKENNLLDRVLISQDAGWYHVGEPGGGSFRPYDTLTTALLPALKKASFTEEELRQIIVLNPSRAFSVRRSE